MTNSKAPSNYFLDASLREIALREELGFTHCIVSNLRTPIAWARSSEAARETFKKLVACQWKEQPAAIVVL